MKASRARRGKLAKPKPTRPVKTDQRLTSFLSTESHLIAIVSLVILVFLCYANSLGNEFVFDDIYLVAQNKQIRSLNLPLLLGTYRPLRDITYALDFALWGEGPFGFHLTNMMLHAANTVLVFVLVRKLANDLLSAVLAALIFTVHPIQTDAVSYISGRRDLLFSFFYLLAFYSYLNYFRSRWSVRMVVHLLLFIVFWVLSLMSKEMAVSLPILIFVWHYCDAWEEGPVWWRQVLQTARRTLMRDKWSWLVLSLGGIAFTAYWVTVKGASRRVRLGNVEYWGGSFYTNFLTVIRVHAWYLKQLVFPTPIAQYLGAFEVSQSAWDWSFVLSLGIVAAVLLYGFWLLNRDRLMAFAIFSYFVLLLPVSQIIPHHELLADHYLYLPLMSFGLFISLLVRKLISNRTLSRKTAYALAAIAVLILAAMTIMQNRTWQNERTLWAANYKAVPNSPRAALNLGNTYQDTDPEKAVELFKTALQLNPTPEIKRTLYDRLTVLLIAQQKLSEAEFYVSEVLDKAPNDFFGNLWASQIYMLRKECDKARARLSLANSSTGKLREVQLAEQAEIQLQQQCGIR